MKLIQRVLVLTTTCRSAAFIRVWDAESLTWVWDISCKYYAHAGEECEA